MCAIFVLKYNVDIFSVCADELGYSKARDSACGLLIVFSFTFSLFLNQCYWQTEALFKRRLLECCSVSVFSILIKQVRNRKQLM